MSGRRSMKGFFIDSGTPASTSSSSSGVGAARANDRVAYTGSQNRARRQLLRSARRGGDRQSSGAGALGLRRTQHGRAAVLLRLDRVDDVLALKLGDHGLDLVFRELAPRIVGATPQPTVDQRSEPARHERERRGQQRPEPSRPPPARVESPLRAVGRMYTTERQSARLATAALAATYSQSRNSRAAALGCSTPGGKQNSSTSCVAHENRGGGEGA